MIKEQQGLDNLIRVYLIISLTEIYRGCDLVLQMFAVPFSSAYKLRFGLNSHSCVHMYTDTNLQSCCFDIKNQ